MKNLILSSKEDVKSGKKKTYIVRSKCLNGLEFGDVVCEDFLKKRIFHQYGIDLSWDEIEKTYPDWFVNYFLYLPKINPVVTFPLDRLRSQDHEQEKTLHI
jgi:hypothetical protein